MKKAPYETKKLRKNYKKGQKRGITVQKVLQNSAKKWGRVVLKKGAEQYKDKRRKAAYLRALAFSPCG